VDSRQKTGLLKNFYKYLLGVLVVAGCSDDDTMPVSDAEYFPLRKGFYQIYSVSETRYFNIGDFESRTFQLKTEVVDSFANQEGGYTYTIYRSERSSAAEPWTFKAVWSVRMNTVNLVVSEENTPFVRIAFPTVINRTWDGNALNTLSADECLLKTVGKSYLLESGDEVGPYIQIVQEDSFDSTLFKDKRQEFYVRGIGLVKREIEDVDYCSTQGECELGAQVIKSGIIYIQTLIEYGQN
jgi:hypothetical protein